MTHTSFARSGVLWLVSLFCLAATSCHDDPAAAPDSGVDGSTGDAEVLRCGDERELLPIPPSPIVNGVESFDPEVVDLTDGQVLAVGAILQNVEGDWMNVCSATLTTPKVVVTAAHCVLIMDWGSEHTASPSEIRFAIGRDAASPEHVFQPETVVRHPDFDLWRLGEGNDVGLLVLAHSAMDDVPELEPIPMNLDVVSRETFVGQRVQNVGYGIVDENDWYDNNSLRWWTVQEVVDMNAGEFVVTGWGETGVCNGDSGGPSLWTMPDGAVRIMGVVSWGEERCVDDTYFTLLHHASPFIDEYLESCGDETATGRCEGDVAIYCDGHTVVSTDCATRGLVCGGDDDGQMRCVEDLCEGETLEGRCEGDDAVWCDGAEVHREHCAAPDWSCDATAEGLMRCVEDPCEGLTLEGECDGDTARWCEAGVLKERRCADCGQRCGWSDEHDGVYCI